MIQKKYTFICDVIYVSTAVEKEEVQQNTKIFQKQLNTNPCKFSILFFSEIDTYKKDGIMFQTNRHDF